MPESAEPLSVVSLESAPLPAWQARLDLRFEAGHGGARLVHNRHEGPLRLLKALGSEDSRRLEAVIVHPPGGLVGGDRLLLDLQVGAGARVLVTTPGAQKWYRSVQRAVASTRLSVGQGAALEWLPQPAIVYDHARVRQSVEVEMADDACSIGWEVLVRGRSAMGETLGSGHLDQTLSISVSRRLLWQERLYADAADRLFGSPLGWNGRRAAATVWCCAPALAAGALPALRDCWRSLLNGEAAAQEAAPAESASEESPIGGATIAAQGLLLAKILANDTEQLMARCQALWRAARLSLEGDVGSLPRIWRT